MIRLELRRLDPIRTANLAALVYAVIMLAVSLLFSPFFFLAGMFGASEGAEALPLMGVPLFMLILYPLMGLVMGWIGGVLSALVFNLVSKWVGGLILDVEQHGVPMGGAVPPTGSTDFGEGPSGPSAPPAY